MSCKTQTRLTAPPICNYLKQAGERVCISIAYLRILTSLLGRSVAPTTYTFVKCM